MLEDLEDCETVEGSYLGMINVDEVIYDPWKVDVKANREGMNFKLDSGADVIVIPKRMVPIEYSTLFSKQETIWTNQKSGLSDCEICCHT